MDTRKRMIVIKGKDQTDSVLSFRFNEDRCEVIYVGAPDKVYNFQRENVEILPLKNRVDPAQVVVSIKGFALADIEDILDYGRYYRIVCKHSGTSGQIYRKDEVVIHQNCLMDGKSRDIFSCFKEIASAISLVADNGINVLRSQYDKIEKISANTVLANYFTLQNEPDAPKMPASVIYPFGLNQSQKTAVERALSSKVSIIQGPPGTGKTQTILNIIANVVRQGKTVAVVSNNNSAIHNVVEKLEKRDVSFITALLGSLANKKRFIEAQTGTYPTMDDWGAVPEEQWRLEIEITALSKELNVKLNAKNRIAEIDKELLRLKPEQHYFKGYYATSGDMPKGEINYSSQKILALWMEIEQHVERNRWLWPHRIISVMLRYGLKAIRLFFRSPETVIPYLQSQFYRVRKRELEQERQTLADELDRYAFDAKMDDLVQKSIRLFRAELAKRYFRGGTRRRFKENDFRCSSAEFTDEYPVILSTTYSIKGTLGKDFVYDYLIVDEASQVDLCTGALALSCAQNIVVVGDLKQLPNVLTEVDIRVSDAIWRKYAIEDKYRFSAHSLLFSAMAVWTNAPVTLLREHYRCHPKIINFCNQRFYDGQLIIMSKDNNEPDVITLHKTVEGNHARGHLNQRQIDVIQREVIPRLSRQGNCRSIGIIAPYRAQVEAIRTQFGNDYEVDTVHKFQGRERDAIVLTSVDNAISDFVDDPHMLNVAVSRAVHSLAVIMSQDSRNDQTNYGALMRYIEYSNLEVVQSKVFSVFDMLYQGYGEQRKAYLRKHKRVSEYASENLMYSVIAKVLSEKSFSIIGCAVHVSLVTLIKDYSSLTEDERRYARNPLTHVDFLLFNKMDKSPVLAIEVDGTAFHRPGSKQSVRDEKKDSIMVKCSISMLRLRTDGSDEHEKVKAAIQKALCQSRPEASQGQ